MKFCIIDASNLVHRAKHVISKYDSFDECVGLTLTIVFNSMKKSYEKFGAEHCVACFDSSSWRKEIYPEYKGDRVAKEKSPIKKEEDEIIWQVLSDLRKFLDEFTNVTVLHERDIEADDFIARWTQLHDDESFEHIIISGDGDFKQLVRPGVELYDPIRNFLYTADGIFYQDGKKPRKEQPVAQKHGETWKVKLTKDGDPETFEPEWELFQLCIRGKKNNLRTAYPRVRTNKMREAYDDRGGPKWNDFINTIWGPEDNRQRVRDRYEENRLLIDLRRQPDEIKFVMDETINASLEKDAKTMVGAYFARFCGKYKLRKLVDQASAITQLLSAPY